MQPLAAPRKREAASELGHARPHARQAHARAQRGQEVRRRRFEADAVVLGDLGDGMTYQRLNRAFRLLLDGAELVTLARNRYWQSSDGLMLDTGPFCSALEHASGKTAILAGKPAPAFFETALASTGIAAAEAAVIGDDLESDVGGGQAAGMRGILVRTGKFREGDLDRSAVRPDAVLASIADLPDILV